MRSKAGTSLPTWKTFISSWLARAASRRCDLASVSNSAIEQLHIQGQRTHFLDEDVERFRNTGLERVFAAHDRFVYFGSSRHVVRLHSQDFLQRIGGAIGLERPDFHLTETLAAELSLAAQRLLRHERVWSDRTSVDLVVHQMVQLEHIDVADRDGARERLAGTAVIQGHLAGRRQARLLQHVDN